MATSSSGTYDITVKVRPRSYNVTVGTQILHRLPTLLQTLQPKAKTFVVVTDDNVEKLHWPTLCHFFLNAGWTELDPNKTSTKPETQEQPPPPSPQPTPNPRQLPQSQLATESQSKSLPQFVHISIGPGGERNKSRATKARIEDFMLSIGCHRDCVVIAFGGGIVGDLAGFVAATFMRGVAYVQVPTTLLAIVDASVGGKTAINTTAGKNLIGAFHQPAVVFVDLHLLTSLPRRHFVNGLAEVVKMAACLDEQFFNLLEAELLSEEGALSLLPQTQPQRSGHHQHQEHYKALLQHIVQRSVELKAHVVEQDEREKGLRAVLNWGHTIGHSIESLSEPRLLHGECVAIGCVKETEIAQAVGICDDTTDTLMRVKRLFSAVGLPTSMPTEASVRALEGRDNSTENTNDSNATSNRDDATFPLPTTAVLEQMLVDKKNSGGAIKCVLLERIGKFAVDPVARVVDAAVFRAVLDRV